ncbi:MAG: DUF3459 domain-containing protein [Gammaproteobacteria bacterium]|nr:DUF3459 domain-containing protein [Gammaproteobacteria bacterium]MCP5136093.1 DUF3459 domain-containing protein [Gammaproteobacteria bacterium]
MADLKPSVSDDFRARLVEHLERIYGESRAVGVADSLVERISRWRRRYKPRKLPVSEACWDQAKSVLITYGDSIQQSGEPPLQTLHRFLDAHLRGVVDTIHILPFFPYSSDDGFSVIDYREVNPHLGDWPDIAAINDGFDLMVDLVINHCSSQSLWFFDYVADVAPYNDYFIEADPSDALSLVTRPRSSTLLKEVRTHRGLKHLWATFSHDQIDLNFANPSVLLEMLDVMLKYVAAGTRILRLDAIAYLWKDVGTNCIHRPQTHEVVKLIRDVLSEVEPHCLLLTETNVPDAENRSYFGEGDEAQMVYQFPLPPLLLHALHTGRTQYLTAWAKDVEANPPPPGCTFLNFTASHDGVGLRPLEGLVPPDEVKMLLHGMHRRGGFLSSRRNTDGSESPYELNISYFDAFREPRLANDPHHIPCFLISQIVALSMQGVPALYIHSLTATHNDELGVELLGRTRAINRRRWDAHELEHLIRDRGSETGQVFAELTRILRLRAQHPAFHPDGPQRVLDLDHQLFGLERRAPDDSERILCLFNFTPVEQRVAVQGLLSESTSVVWSDLLSGGPAEIDAGQVVLAPYAACWLVDSAPL